MKRILSLPAVCTLLLGGCKAEPKGDSSPPLTPFSASKMKAPPPNALKKPQREPTLKGSTKARSSSLPPSPLLKAPDPAVQLMAKGVNTMGAKLFALLTRDNTTRGTAVPSAKANVVLSPYSIASALLLAWAGARGETEREFAQLFSSSLPFPRQHEAMSSLLHSLEGAKNIQINLANALWVERTLPVERSYLKNIRAWYKTPPFKADFKGDPDGVTERINSWVSTKTHTRIPSLVPKKTLRSTHRAVLVNAIWFQAKWALPFPQHRTKVGAFYPAPGYKVEVKTMHLQGRFAYSKNRRGDLLLELPYKGGRFTFLIYLPASFTPFATVDLETIRRGFPHPRLTDIALALPRMELSQKFFLESHMAKLLPLAFSERANFKGITTAPEGLVLNQMIHDTVLKVNETGTKAAAATALLLGEGARMTPVPRISIDRPFLFYIIDKATGVALFTGHIVNPDPAATVQKT